MTKRRYEGIRVMVTGADGFIGSHLTEALVREGASVRAFCIYNSNGSHGWLDGLTPDVEKTIDFRLGDIRDGRFVEEACDGVDIIFHLAALIAIPYSYSAPQSFIDTNVSGTMHVLEAVRRKKNRRVIQTSTSEVYGTPATVPIRETHPLQGQSPYSATKIAADKLCEAYFSSFDVPVVTMRPFNTYGPRQSARAVIPTVLTQLMSGQTKIKLGALDPKRDLTFVDDTVEGYLLAGLKPGIEGETIHLGTGRTDSVKEMFDAACRALKVQATVEEDKARLRPSKSEVMVLLSDPAKAKAMLGWQAKISLEEGLARTAEWLRPNLSKYRPDGYAK